MLLAGLRVRAGTKAKAIRTICTTKNKMRRY
jgi:hypothetical protein